MATCYCLFLANRRSCHTKSPLWLNRKCKTAFVVFWCSPSLAHADGDKNTRECSFGYIEGNNSQFCLANIQICLCDIHFQRILMCFREKSTDLEPAAATLCIYPSLYASKYQHCAVFWQYFCC